MLYGVEYMITSEMLAKRGERAALGADIAGGGGSRGGRLVIIDDTPSASSTGRSKAKSGSCC